MISIGTAKYFKFLFQFTKFTENIFFPQNICASIHQQKYLFNVFIFEKKERNKSLDRFQNEYLHK